MPRLLIAHSSHVYANRLARLLTNRFDVRICCNGCQAANILDSFQPDVLILSTCITHKDALSILLDATHTTRFILVVTNFLTPQAENQLYSLGVHKILLMPSVHDVCNALTGCLDTPESTPNTLYQVQMHLRKLNLPIQMEGFAQICTAVSLLMQDVGQTLSKHIYPAVAKLQGSTDQRAVEHTIRNCIKAGWKNRDDSIWAMYFPPKQDQHIPCPSNRQFLCALAGQIRQQFLKDAPEPTRRSPFDPV